MINEELLLGDIKRLEVILDELLSTNIKRSPDVSDIQEDLQPIAMKLTRLSNCLFEVEEATKQIAAGNFHRILRNQNPYAGALKELQSSFQHLTWQLGRVAQGDYEQQVDYLGEVSKAFNTMIQQLKERERLLVENVELTKKLANQQSQLLEQEIKRQVERYQHYTKSMEDVRIYRHDMSNHLLGLHALLQEGNTTEALEYIESLSEIFQSKQEVQNNRNYILHALLEEKFKQAKKLKIKVETNIKITRKVKLSNMDWCILYGNALDNALEALRKVPQKQRWITINIQTQGNMLCSEIRNRMVGSIQIQEDQRIETSKQEKHLHGIGLKNIQNCVKKYDGEVKIITKDHSFILSFILCGV